MVRGVNGVSEAELGSALSQTKPHEVSQKGFDKVLSQAIQADIKFSKHAIQRIASRGIPLDGIRLEKLKTAMELAQSRGANESLVLIDELALIVSVKNRTVITAMESARSGGSVFTSIDSAVIA